MMCSIQTRAVKRSIEEGEENSVKKSLQGRISLPFFHLIFILFLCSGFFLPFIAIIYLCLPAHSTTVVTAISPWLPASLGCCVDDVFFSSSLKFMQHFSLSPFAACLSPFLSRIVVSH